MPPAKLPIRLPRVFHEKRRPECLPTLARSLFISWKVMGTVAPMRETGRISTSSSATKTRAKKTQNPTMFAWTEIRMRCAQ
jgi:hypothetical protein